MESAAAHASDAGRCDLDGRQRRPRLRPELRGVQRQRVRLHDVRDQGPREPEGAAELPRQGLRPDDGRGADRSRRQRRAGSPARASRRRRGGRGRRRVPMNEGGTSLVQWLGTLGVGGVLAAFMFAAYRKDMKAQSELWRVTSEQLFGVVKENTASLTRLVTMLETAERNAVRRADLR